MIKTIPIRLDYYQYCVETWEKIFEQLDFQKIKTIIDFCPGWSPKLGLALLKTNFSGILYAIDESHENLNLFKSLIDPFPKKFCIKYISADIMNPGNKFQNLSADLILANHIIDDMALGHFLKGKNSKIELFENAVFMKQTWLEILKKKNNFRMIASKLRNTFTKLLNPNGYLLIAQYMGYQESLYGLEKVYTRCSSVIENIKKDFYRTKEFAEKEEILTSAFLKIKNPYFPKKDIFCFKKN
jgi:hypothetical protein